MRIPYVIDNIEHTLAGEPDEEGLFALGHVVATAGAAALNVDFSPYLARHSIAN